jgi:hypothetical protein
MGWVLFTFADSDDAKKSSLNSGEPKVEFCTFKDEKSKKSRAISK